MELRLSSRRIFRVHLALIAVLVCAHGFVRVGCWLTGTQTFYGLAPLFTLDLENNLPALFSSVAMLAAAGLLGATAEHERRLSSQFVAHWRGLGGLFVFLAVDEAVALHERLNDPVGHALGTSGPLVFAWVIPYAFLTGLVAMGLTPFLGHLEKETRRDFIVAGVVYVTGALILELAGGQIWVSFGHESLAYFLETAVEETLEMVGIALFVRAIIAHNERRNSLAPVPSTASESSQ